ncbi:hypothetical protein HN51_032829 [Arachis hypogaea]
MSTERLNKTSERVKDNGRTMLETEELGVSILQDLHSQRQSLLHAHNTKLEVAMEVFHSRKGQIPLLACVAYLYDVILTNIFCHKRGLATTSVSKQSE